MSNRSTASLARSLVNLLNEVDNDWTTVAAARAVLESLAEDVRTGEIRVGDVAIAGTAVNPTYTVVRTLDDCYRDSILPHVTVNGILTLPYRAPVRAVIAGRGAR